MAHLIDKDALVAEIKRRKNFHHKRGNQHDSCVEDVLYGILSYIDTLEVIDPYKQYIQYASIEVGIKAHAEDYSFNIESELFNQLTKEQQALWRKEIEQAAISGGYNGLGLAKDPRYKENLEVKKVDLEKEIQDIFQKYKNGFNGLIICNKTDFSLIAKHFFELGLKAQKGE